VFEPAQVLKRRGGAAKLQGGLYAQQVQGTLKLLKTVVDLGTGGAGAKVTTTAVLFHEALSWECPQRLRAVIIDDVSSICQASLEQTSLQTVPLLLCPLVTLEKDDVWTWSTLSKIVDQINQTGVWTATLLSEDGPAVFLCKQNNTSVGMPYELVMSEVGLIGLTEPALPTVAATPSGGLAYQVREYLQAIAERDCGYWAR
jgi:hypothetical protein